MDDIEVPTPESIKAMNRAIEGKEIIDREHEEYADKIGYLTGTQWEAAIRFLLSAINLCLVMRNNSVLKGVLLPLRDRYNAGERTLELHNAIEECMEL